MKMLSFKEFCERVRNELPDLFARNEIFRINIEQITKNNGTFCMGLTFQTDAINISPVIYLEPYYKSYTNGRVFANVLYDIAETYENYKPKKNFDVNSITNFDIAKEYINCRLVNFELNKQELENRPYKKLEDLAITYHLEFETMENGAATVAINNKLLERYGITTDELDALARENMKKLSPPFFQNMETLLLERMLEEVILSLDIDENEATELIKNSYQGTQSMYVVSNKQKMYGASAILDHDIMDMIADKFGEKFYVIPSSIHECLVIPFDGNIEQYKKYEQMVKDVNDTQVERNEILSYKMYMIDAKKHVFMSCEHAYEMEQKMQKKEQKQSKEFIQDKGNKKWQI